MRISDELHNREERNETHYGFMESYRWNYAGLGTTFIHQFNFGRVWGQHASGNINQPSH
jgi:hypothetical protein